MEQLQAKCREARFVRLPGFLQHKWSHAFKVLWE